MYQFIVDFIGEVPENFVFIYSILTLIVSLCVFGTFIGLFYFVLKLVKGVI